MAQSPTFKTEVFVPIKRDDQLFEERQKRIWDDIQRDLDKDFRHTGSPMSSVSVGRGGAPGMSRDLWDQSAMRGGGQGGGIWDDMHSRMDRRRMDWDSEVDRMRNDFFKLRPSDRLSGGPTDVAFTSSNADDLRSRPDQREMYEDNGRGNKRFRVSFDVSQFSPAEITVRTQDQKLIVHAKHEETGEGKNICREFSRQIDVPKNMEPEKMQCTLSKDGILQVEAPIPAPSYEGICSPDGGRVRRQEDHIASTSSPIRIQAQPPQYQQVQALHSASPQGSRTSDPTGFKSGPVLTEHDGARMLKMTVEIGTDFKPEEVMVKTVDRKLQISAKHEEKAEGRTTMREFSKELELPENVDPNSVTASMTDDGKLVIEAPMAGYTRGSYEGAPGSTKHPEIKVAFN